MKRQKWVDVWDGENYQPLVQDAVPAPVPKFSGQDKVWNREMGVGQSTATEDEPRTPPPTQGSITYEVNNPSESRKTSLPSSSGHGGPKEARDMGPPHPAVMPVHKPLGTEVHSDRDVSNTDRPGQINPTLGGAGPMVRGLNSSRWAQGGTNISHHGHNSPAKTIDLHQLPAVSTTPFNKRDNDTRPYIPSAKAGVSGTTQEAIDVTLRLDAQGPHISATVSAKQHTEVNKAADATTPAEASKESNDAKVEAAMQKTKTEPLQGTEREHPSNQNDDKYRGRGAEKEASLKQETKDKVKVSSGAQHRDTWEGRQSDSKPHPGLSEVFDKSDQLTSIKPPPSDEVSIKPPPSDEVVPAPLTQGALRAKFGSCPEDRSESDDPLSRVSATGVENENIEESSFLRDPRGEWPEEPKPEQDWNQTRRPKPKKYWESDSIHSDDMLIVSGPMKKFVLWWVKAIPDVESDFLKRKIPDHHRCDIDTLTGVLNEPIDYPDTMRASGSDWAQFNRTTQEVINQAMLLQSSKLVKVSRKKTKREIAAHQFAMQRAMEEAMNPEEVQIPCHIRPATADDMEAVAAIYNQEVEKSYTVVDTQPIHASRFRNLLNICKTLHQPFVVAVDGWHRPDVDSSNQVIHGFCLVDSLAKGIMGSRDTSTKCCGKITLVVQPDFRLKKIGTALLDVIMNCCSTKHSSRQGYQWVCDPNDTTHVSPPHNSRNWDILHMEVLVKSGKSVEEVKEREKWIIDFLESKFLLILNKHDDHFCYHPTLETGGGTRYWLDRFIFEHRSRDYNM